MIRKARIKQILIEAMPIPITAFARNTRGKLRRIIYFRNLEKLIPHEVSLKGYHAQMLVVHNPSYVNVSQVCVLSFLKFNPESRISIRVDAKTTNLAEKIYAKEIRQGRVFLKDISSNTAPWQEQKVDLICSMSGEDEFYMDADLRWNGPLKLSGNLTFFVRETLIGEHNKYSVMFEKIGLSWINETYMKNTSFFSWGNHFDHHLSKKKVKSVYIQILESLKNNSLNLDVKSDLVRLSEQIAFSATLDDAETGLTYLKEADQQMDGSILESSYYGATGSSF